MSQLSFSDVEFAGKRKVTRREKFLAEMERAVLWKLLADYCGRYVLEAVNLLLADQGKAALPGGASVSGDQVPVWIHQGALPGTCQERCAVEDAVTLANVWKVMATVG
ncbi:hypothetical protein CCAE64S_02345 [Castellaniella caeni]